MKLTTLLLLLSLNVFSQRPVMLYDNFDTTFDFISFDTSPISYHVWDNWGSFTTGFYSKEADGYSLVYDSAYNYEISGNMDKAIKAVFMNYEQTKRELDSIQTEYIEFMFKVAEYATALPVRYKDNRMPEWVQMFAVMRRNDFHLTVTKNK